jgi:transporter family-2 protein
VSRSLAVFLGAGAGALVGLQAPINSRLGKSVGGVQAATFSFIVGTVALVAITFLLRGGFSSYGSLGSVPWWAMIGGLLGAVYVFVALEAVKYLGASGLTAVVIAGQLAASVVVDRFGLLGIARTPITLDRIIGLVLLVAGVALVVRK